MAKVTISGYGDLAFLPLEAGSPFRETVGWMTDLFRAVDGSEDSIALRQAPRQGFGMTYVAQPTGSERDAFNTLYGALTLPWAIPVWSEAAYVGTVNSGATGVSVDTTVRDFRAGTLALLWGGSRGDWEIVKLTTVLAGSVTFPATASTVRNAYILPVRVGRVKSQPTRQVGGFGQLVKLEYEVDDNIAFVPAAPTQFLGEDIYFDESLLGSGESIGEKIFTDDELTDFEVGRVENYTFWANSRTNRQHRVFCNDAIEAWNFKLWLHRRMGKYRRFWQPSFTSDLRLFPASYPTPILLGNVVGLYNNYYTDWASGRTHIAFQSISTKAWVVRTVEGHSGPGVNVNVTLDDSVGLVSDDIARICFLGLKRLDTDRVEIDWIGNGKCESSMQIVEVSP